MYVAIICNSAFRQQTKDKCMYIYVRESPVLPKPRLQAPLRGVYLVFPRHQRLAMQTCLLSISIMMEMHALWYSSRARKCNAMQNSTLPAIQTNGCAVDDAQPSNFRAHAFLVGFRRFVWSRRARGLTSVMGMPTGSSSTTADSPP